MPAIAEKIYANLMKIDLSENKAVPIIASTKPIALGEFLKEVSVLNVGSALNDIQKINNLPRL